MVSELQERLPLDPHSGQRNLEHEAASEDGSRASDDGLLGLPPALQQVGSLYEPGQAVVVNFFCRHRSLKHEP
jgi:hypothetical protein